MEGSKQLFRSLASEDLGNLTLANRLKRISKKLALFSVHFSGPFIKNELSYHIINSNLYSKY